MKESHERIDGRRAERRDAMAASTLRTDGATPLDVMVLDLSATGVRILTNAELTIGQEISIGLAGAGATRAFVAWRRDTHYGCAFTKPLSAEDEARAFSNAAPIRLGLAARAEAPSGDAASLDELYRRHHHWMLPADSILALIAYAGLAVFGVRTLLC